MRQAITVAILALASGTSLASAQTLTYGSGVPERSGANRFGVLPMMERITDATEGRVTFTPILGGQLVSIPGALRGIADGVVDSGFFLTQFHPAELPAASLMSEVTGLGTDPFATIGALNEAFFVTCDACRSDLRATGLVPLLLQSATPLTMQCTRPVATLTDLQGLRVSTIGQPEARWGASLGMVPVNTSIADILTGLQLGQTDCTLVGTSWIRSYGLEDTVKSVIEMPQGIIAGAVPLAFNAGAWDRIDAADRAAMVDLMPRMLWDYVADAYVEPDEAVRAELSDAIAFVPGDEALASAWQTFQADEQAALVTLAQQRGVENPEELVAAIVEVFRVWHEDLLPEFDGDPEAFERIARERIFSLYDF
ncbi:MAG: hypothetical protein JJU15_01760 [Pararhodobacter sp.]|nr:hypothetical protein [Pararhodobacter sp.]